jgi:hypothetical protein
MTKSRILKASASFFGAIFVATIVGLYFPPNSTPREHWLTAYALILSMFALLGGAIGALFGRYWIGFILGIVLPFIAFFVFAGGFPC